MDKNKSEYLDPMEPWPSLEPLSKTTYIPKTEIDIFFYESSKIDKPALLLIHGLGDEADTWRHVIPAFADQFRIIAPDLPGFGRSGQPNVDYTPDFLIDTLMGLLDQLNIDNTFVMGNSLGAILAHAIAGINSESVRGLILVGGALLQVNPKSDLSLRLMTLPFWGEWLYTRLRKNPEAAFDSLRTVYHDLDTFPQADRDFLFRRVNKRVWSDGQRRAYFSTLRNLSVWIREKQTTAQERLMALEVPTLMIRGEFDTLFSEESAKRIVGIQRNSKLATINTAGHLPHQEQPAEFNRVIAEWLRKSLT